MHEASNLEEPTTADWARKHWWALPAATILLLAALAMFFSTTEDHTGRQTSYDASGEGLRAAFLLLDELGYPVARWKRRYVGTDNVRFIQFPYANLDDAEQIAQWVADGGTLVLADVSEEFADAIGIDLDVHATPSGPSGVSVPGASELQLWLGTRRVEWPGGSGDAWASTSDQPVVTTYRRGDGEIWLVNYPDIFSNEALRTEENGVFLCRFAEKVLRNRTGELLFDEYFHGMHDRPSVWELLFTPPAVWGSLQAFVLVGLLLWHYAPRFGAIRPTAPPSRRSKEEFLDAMAALLDEKRNYADAYRTVRDGFLREMEHELGLPAGTPLEKLVGTAAQQRSLPYERLRALLMADAPPDGGGAAAFLKSVNELESARDEFFRSQRNRRPV